MRSEGHAEHCLRRLPTAAASASRLCASSLWLTTRGGAQGPALYYVDSEGKRLKGKRFSVGSGSLYAYGVLDEGYKWDMSVAEARELGRRAIYHATFRDAYSGGTVSVYHVTEKGWEKVSGDDVGELHYKYYPDA